MSKFTESLKVLKVQELSLKSLYSDFNDLKSVGRYQTSKCSVLPYNMPKNRYKGILSYDRSRVKLEIINGEDGSDYINANFVKGFFKPKEYIATQGPLSSTENDFWRMCWETKAVAIVMLARCMEKGFPKCHRYWPEDYNTVKYGDITVEIMYVTYFKDWNISEFHVSRGEESRQMKHFQFLNWPDTLVPKSPELLNFFIKLIRSELSDSREYPIVVHCSAGIGRTGTFIAVDHGLLSLRYKKSVDIFNIVYQMRHDRYSMVQTKIQYVFIYRCMLAAMNKDHTFLEMRRVISVDIGVRPIGDSVDPHVADTSKDDAEASCSGQIEEKVKDTSDKRVVLSKVDIDKKIDSDENITTIYSELSELNFYDKIKDKSKVETIDKRDGLFDMVIDRECDSKNNINHTIEEFFNDKTKDLTKIEMIDQKDVISEMDVDKEYDFNITDGEFSRINVNDETEDLITIEIIDQKDDVFKTGVNNKNEDLVQNYEEV